MITIEGLVTNVWICIFYYACILKIIECFFVRAGSGNVMIF